MAVVYVVSLSSESCSNMLPNSCNRIFNFHWREQNFLALRYKGITTIKEVKLPPKTPRIEMKEAFVNEALKFAVNTLCRERLT